MATIANSKRKDAERAVEHALVEVYGCTHTWRARSAMYGSVDLFGCDAVGKLSDGTHVWVQVTAGQANAVSQRKLKITRYPWGLSDRVFVWQLAFKKEGRRKVWFFRTHELDTMTYVWTTGPAIAIKPEWFKAR